MSDTTDRLRLPYPDGADGPDGPDVPHWMQRLAAALDRAAIVGDQGPRASRPAAGVRGTIYYATDLDQLWYDTGTDWQIIGVRPGTLVFTFEGLPGVGHLPCDGRAVSRTAYADLFAAIGTSAGVGDGRTTFNVPDYQDVLPLGASGTRPRGSAGGEERHTLTVGEMPPHNHGGAASGVLTNQALPTQLAPGQANTIYSNPPYSAAAAFGAVSTSLTIPSQGGGQAHNNMPPYLACNVWIKA